MGDTLAVFLWEERSAGGAVEASEASRNVAASGAVDTNHLIPVTVHVATLSACAFKFIIATL
jgi:hypothetical protein